MRSLINILELSAEEIAGLIATAEDIIADPQKYAEACHGKKLATLFFEPSTRTRSSFEIAEKRLSADSLNFGGSSTATVKPWEARLSSPSSGSTGSGSRAYRSRIRRADTDALRNDGTVRTRALKAELSLAPWDRNSVMVPYRILPDHSRYRQ